MALPTNFTDQKIDTVQNTDRKYIPTLNDDNTYSFTDVTVYEDNGSKFTASNMNATNTQVNINTNKIGTEPLNTTSQNLCGAINEQQRDIDDLNTTLDNVSEQLEFPSGNGFYLDEKDGKAGYNTSADRGADTFHPFSSSKVIYLGTGATFDVKTKLPNDYNKLTLDNFLIIPQGSVTADTGDIGNNANRSRGTASIGNSSYNANTGILTAGGLSVSTTALWYDLAQGGKSNSSQNSKAYVILGDIE